MIVLGLLAFVFSALNLSNQNEALGLPSGTVRAVIALMLLVIFAIVAIFLYSDVSSSKLMTRSRASRTKMLRGLAQAARRWSRHRAARQQGTFKVYRQQTSSTAGDDLRSS